jgi:hypothetical protein
MPNVMIVTDTFADSERGVWRQRVIVVTKNNINYDVLCDRSGSIQQHLTTHLAIIEFHLNIEENTNSYSIVSDPILLEELLSRLYTLKWCNNLHTTCFKVHSLSLSSSIPIIFVLMYTDKP